MIVRKHQAIAPFWLETLAPAEAERTRAGLTEKTYPPGSYVWHRGDRVEAWTGVVAGLVKISAISSDGRAMTFAGVGAGGWFGEGSVLKNEPRKYDLVALRETRLGFLNMATFNWLTERSVGFNRFLLRQLNERMGQFIATIEYDRLLDPTVRVARHISWLCNPVLYPGVGDRVEISQEELALLAGVSRAHAGKALQTLEREGLVTVARGALNVCDVARLGAYGAP